jgi:TonB family protein
MEGYLDYVWKSAIIMAVFYFVYIVFFRRDKNFTFNRGYLLITPLLSAVIPLANISLQSPVFTSNLVEKIYLPSVIIADLSPSTPSIDSNWPYIVTLFYFSGLVFFSWRLLLQIRRFRKIIAEQRPNNSDEYRFSLIYTDGYMPTGSFLNYIFYDNSRDLNENEKHQILLHEEAHISQHHSYDLLYMELFVIVFWFNPFIRLLRKELQAVHEYLADEAVAAKTENMADYLSVLASQSLSALNLSYYNQFNTSQIFKRMNMLNSNRKRPLIWNLVVTVPIAAVLFVVFGCQTADTDQPQSSENKAAQVIGTDELIFEESANDNQVAKEYKVYEDVDEVPGNIENLYKHIQKSIRYPEEAKKAGVEGKVFVQFIVDKNGKINNVQAIKGIGAGCDEEAVMVIASGPDLTPGIVKGEAVNTRLVIPVAFKLSEKDKLKNNRDTSAPDTGTKNEEKEITVVGYKE